MGKIALFFKLWREPKVIPTQPGRFVQKQFVFSSCSLSSYRHLMVAHVSQNPVVTLASNEYLKGLIQFSPFFLKGFNKNKSSVQNRIVLAKHQALKSQDLKTAVHLPYYCCTSSLTGLLSHSIPLVSDSTLVIVLYCCFSLTRFTDVYFATLPSLHVD